MSLLTDRGENGIREHTSVTVGTEPSLVPAEARLMAVEFYNNGSVVVYVSHDGDGIAAEGRPIPAGGSWTDAASRGPWYLATESSTADVRITKVRVGSSAAG